MDLLRSLPIGLYVEKPFSWLHRLDSRVKLGWLMSLILSPLLANGPWRIFFSSFSIINYLVIFYSLESTKKNKLHGYY